MALNTEFDISTEVIAKLDEAEKPGKTAGGDQKPAAPASPAPKAPKK
jgi:hypothetical protein